MPTDFEPATDAGFALEGISDPRDVRIARLVAEVDGLIAAQEQRAIIEQAKGVIMSTMRCSADAAFAVLVAQSQAQNRKVRDIANELAAAQDRQRFAARASSERG